MAFDDEAGWTKWFDLAMQYEKEIAQLKEVLTHCKHALSQVDLYFLNSHGSFEDLEPWTSVREAQTKAKLFFEGVSNVQD